MKGKERYSCVARRTFGDARVRALSSPPPNGQSLFIRLLIGPELTNIPGLIIAGEQGLAEALGWPLKGFREAFAEVSAQGLAKADWGARLVWVPKSLKHNRPQSPNVVLSWRTMWVELPECDLKREAYQAMKRFFAEHQAFAKAFAEACPDPSANQEQEQEQKDPSGGRGRPRRSPLAKASPKKSESEAACDRLLGVYRARYVSATGAQPVVDGRAHSGARELLSRLGGDVERASEAISRGIERGIHELHAIAARVNDVMAPSRPRFGARDADPPESATRTNIEAEREDEADARRALRTPPSPEEQHLAKQHISNVLAELDAGPRLAGGAQ